MTRTLPFRVEPLPGESLSSWLRAIANAHQSPLSDLIPWVSKESLRRSSLDLDSAGLKLQETLHIAKAVGIPLESVQMTWQPLESYAARIQNSKLSVGWLRPKSTSRFCPQCLAINGGRWMAAWRIPWNGVCVEHKINLCNECPFCKGSQRSRPARTSYVPGDGWLCEEPVAGSTGVGDHRCHGDLCSTLRFAASERVVQLVQELSDLTDPDNSVESGPSLERLYELYSMARLRFGRTGNLNPFSSEPETLQGALEDLIDESRFREVVLARVESMSGPIAPSIVGVTPSTAARMATIRDEFMSPTTRLRWCSPSNCAAPVDDIELARFRWRYLPRAFWVDWCVHLFPRFDVHIDTLRRVLSVAVASVGLSNSAEDVAEGFCEIGMAKRLGRVLSANFAGEETAVLRSLIEIGSRLGKEGGAIDYARRRSEFVNGVSLSRGEWTTICRIGGIEVGSERKLFMARQWLFTTLTGELVTEHVPNAESDEHFLTKYNEFLRYLTPLAVRALHKHAKDTLEGLGIDEPVDWSPPRNWVTTHRAGPDLEEWPAQQVVDELRRGVAAKDIAKRLNTDPAAVNYFVYKNPPGVRLRGRGLRQKQRPVPDFVTADWIQVQRIEHRLNLQMIAEDLNISKRILSVILREAGVDPQIRIGKTRIDPQWLREQYVDKHRTADQIAEELGVSNGTVTRIAKAQGLAMRRGPFSHRVVLDDLHEVPEPLRTILREHWGEQRVTRFQVIARCNWIREAEMTLGISLGTAVNQLGMMERSIGSALIRRAAHGHDRQQLTPMGILLLRQADKRFGAPSVSCGSRRPL